MTLAASEIRIEKYSVLGPVDPQIPTPDGMHPAGSIATLVKTKPITLDVVQAKGLNVVKGISDMVYESFKAFASTGPLYGRP